MSARAKFSASDLDVMRRAAVEIRQAVTDGQDPQTEDVATLARFVVDLVDEVDTLVFRATLATMALDGRVTVDQIVVQ